MVDDKRVHLSTVKIIVELCTECGLHEGANPVLSRGNPDAPIMIVGEAPGQQEDEDRLPFVGPSGKVLDRALEKFGVDPDIGVYVCNAVNHRPPENRTPTTAELRACRPYLDAQIHWVQPKVIVALGKTAAGALGFNADSRAWRGQWGLYDGRIPTIATYHPSYLLRDKTDKKRITAFMEDLRAAVVKAAEVAED